MIIQNMNQITKHNRLQITEADLYDNQIIDILPLSELVNLKTLYLDSNQIRDISPLANLVNLKILSLYDNQISNISLLSKLVNLESVISW